MALPTAPHTVFELLRDSYISAALVAYPAWRILRRAGVNRFYVLTLLVPWFGIMLLGAALAFNTWPSFPPSIKKKKKQSEKEAAA